MKRGINEHTVVGNVGEDSIDRYNGDDAVTSFSVATNEVWKDKKTGEEQSRTTWHPVVVFGNRAQFAGEVIKKGVEIFVKGPLIDNPWTKEGESKPRERKEIRITNFDGDFQVMGLGAKPIQENN